ncbi:tumor necrosis factor receptor superfamily member 5 isoform X2 [Megalops cyprinoides]|uniref:tumor necrosis factor receptor superfamily member 5 isoform X2 n=1 Tax=Megalops cyprinoides TaxID=118141 RepID=UPI0018641390|nr:tumor necrosis factor receptor superfamily member 5 isoform X2 [Megalops cyprinoides]
MSGNTSCSAGEFSHKNRCCKGCPKGQYASAACEESQETKCRGCPHGHFTDEVNLLGQCRACTICHSSSHMVSAGECSAVHDRLCKCQEGFYCTGSVCELCQPVKLCNPGFGVKTLPTARTDTKCIECVGATYNNVTDSKTSCLKHTNCTALGMDVKVQGTKYKDAVCAPKSTHNSHWILPASLWIGLVLTVVIIGLSYLYWRNKRRSQATVNTSEIRMNAILLHLPKTGLSDPAPCKDRSHHFCSFPTAVKTHPMKSLDSDFDGRRMPTKNSLDLECDGPGLPRKNSLDLDCDGPGLPTLPCFECLDESAARGGKTENITTSTIQSEPQEDEWSGT